MSTDSFFNADWCKPALDMLIDGEHLEIEDFIQIQEELERISITVETLQLWSEQKLASGEIDINAYNAARNKKKVNT